MTPGERTVHVSAFLPEADAAEEAREGRVMYRLELDFLAEWAEKFYAKRQVAPVVIEEGGAMVVITVYVFYY